MDREGRTPRRLLAHTTAPRRRKRRRHSPEKQRAAATTADDLTHDDNDDDDVDDNDDVNDQFSYDGGDDGGDDGADDGQGASGVDEWWGALTHDNGGWHGDPSPRVVAAFKLNNGHSGGGGGGGGGGGEIKNIKSSKKVKTSRRRYRCDIAVVEGSLDPADFAADYLHVGRAGLTLYVSSCLAFEPFVAVCRRLLLSVPEPTEDILLNNSKILD